MDIGIGLPATIPGIDGRTLTSWARRADERGFSSLGVIDRIVYPNYEPLLALAAAAAMTERIKLATTVLLGPLRTNTALLAQEIATLDNLSRGRFVLGIAVGVREDDFEASGASMKGRGARLDAQLQELKRIWSGQGGRPDAAMGPPPAREGGPEILVGGHADASMRRAARFGDGWIMGGGTPDQFGEFATKLDEAWPPKAARASPARRRRLTSRSARTRARTPTPTYATTTAGSPSTRTRSSPRSRWVTRWSGGTRRPTSSLDATS